MSLLFLDAMEHVSGQQIHHKYDRVSISFAMTEFTAGGRFNSSCIGGVTAVGQIWCGVSTATVSKMITGLAMTTGSLAGASVPFLRFMCNSVQQMGIYYTPTRTLVLYCGSAGSVASYATSVFVNSSWNWIEMEGCWHSTTGSCTVYISDVQIVSFTGDTTNGAPASGLNQADWRVPNTGGSAGAYFIFNGFYLMNDLGNANKTRVGSTARIRTYYASGDGTVSMTPLVAGNNWSQVGETVATGAGWNATTYVHASVASTYDLYTLGSVTSSWGASENPWGLQVAAAALTISGTATIAVQMVVSGIQLITAAQTLSTAYTLAHRLVADTKPSGSAWAVSTLSALQIGAGMA